MKNEWYGQKKRITLDFETRSKSNLKTEGAYKYSLDPTTRPTCLAFKRHGKDKPLHFFKFEEINRPWAKHSEKFRIAWQTWIDDGWEFSAHNAFFETCIYKNILVKRYGWPDIPFRQFRCTAAKAAACALPRDLEGAGSAMQLRIQKDRRGYDAMMKTCKPTRQWNAWTKARAEIAAGKKVGPKKRELAAQPEPPLFLEYRDAPDVWETLYRYCKIDVLAEEQLDDALPDLIPIEQELWFLNQQLNWRGLRFDIPTVKKIVGIMQTESDAKLQELDALTMGLVTKPGARRSILEFLALEGVELPNMQAKTVDDVLKSGELSSDMRRLLEIKKALSKTSTRKYQGILARANSDGSVRDILKYHGAHTGRDGGAGIQPHNFPKPIIPISKERPYAAVQNIIDCDPGMLHLMYGESLGYLFSSVLRNMILPDPGYELFVSDFAKIEVAVCWWLAGNERGLNILRSGKDPYKYQAAANTRKLYEDIEDDGPDRQLGKAQVLGAQFGMGGDKFQTTAWDFYRLKLTIEESKKAIKDYREANPQVPQMWKNLEQAALVAIENKKRVTVNRCTFFCERGFLWIQLPSGRRLTYRDPRTLWRETDWGPQKTVEYWAVNSKTKKWTQHRTWGGTLTENVVQAVARDCMMHKLLEAERQGYQLKLTVHDEVICQNKIGKGGIEEFNAILCHKMPWSKGLPLEAKGWIGPRYRK